MNFKTPTFQIFIILILLLNTACNPLLPSVRKEAFGPLEINKPAPSGQSAPENRISSGEDEKGEMAAEHKLRQDITAIEQQQSSFNQKLAELRQSGLPKDISQSASGKDTVSVDGRQPVEFHFESADLLEVIRLMMQHLLKEDFIVYPGVQGQVTMEINDKLTGDQILRLLEGVLQINKMTMYKEDKRWHIMPLDSAPSNLVADRLLLPKQELVPHGQQIKAFRLRYLALAEMVKILTPYLSKGAQLYAHEPSGVMLVCDYPYVLEKIVKIIELFDVGPFAGMLMKVYWPQFVMAEDVIKELDALAKGLSLSSLNPNSNLSFIAMPRLNLLLAMTRDEEMLRFVDLWMGELDRQTPQVLQQSQEEGVFVYSVKNGSAEEIVKVLEGLFGASRKIQEPTKEKDEKLPSGVQLTRLTSGLEKEVVPIDHPDAVSGSLSGPVTFVIDPVTNAVLVRSNASDYQKILPVIEKLDAYPKQALIEVTIAEIQLDESNKLGIEWQYLMKNVAGSNATGLLSVDSGLGVVSGSGNSLIGSGLSYLLVNTDRFTAALKAFSDQNRVNILSSPHILASDNQEAKIDIGDEVPIVTSEYRTTDSSSTATTVDKTIQYRDVGIILSVIPHINENGMVRLEVSQEVSELSNKTVEGVASPIFSKRAANTKLSVQDGQTVVIAGLIQQSSSNGYSGIPILGRMPLLRYLFGYEGRSYRNTELMIFITPHVVLNEGDSQFITSSFLQRLNSVRSAMKF